MLLTCVNFDLWFAVNDVEGLFARHFAFNQCFNLRANR